VKRVPGEAPEKEGEEPFLSRWSRMKEESRQAPSRPPAKTEEPPADPPPALPPVEELTPDSDYRAFFHPRVDEGVRRAALRKLFSDPHFNVMDGLDVYIGDYSKNDPIPAAMLAQMDQVRKILEWAKEDGDRRGPETRESRQESPAPALEPPPARAEPAAGAPSASPASAAPGSGTPRS
jgi:hypothetical protein